jgi:hypothetical protein
MRVIVVGAGGVGGWLVRGLAPMLEVADPGSLLMLLDGDTFEEKNRQRQDFGEYGYKANVRAGELQPRYPECLVIGQAYWVVGHTEGWPEEDGGSVGVNLLVEEGDVVFATVDNHAARKLIFERAMELDNVDVFTGGNDDAYFGSLYHYQRRNGVDITDPPFDWHPEMVDPPDRNPAELSCEERAKIDGGTQLLATNMAVASYLLAAFHNTILTNTEPARCEIFFDLALGLSNGYDRRPAVDLTTTEIDIRQEENING